jgi:hypothetical protein
LKPLAEDVSLAANLRRIGRLLANWPGERIDDAGVLPLTEGDGAGIPIYWCFNAANEFSALSQTFGDDQPLVGMRSLHQIIDITPATTHAFDDLADYYAGHLLRRFGRSQCIVGGNCQAAAISYRVAVRLLDAGVPVLRLVTVDAEPRYPYPGHVRLLFGRDSRFNPFLSRQPNPDAEPLRSWRLAYGRAEWQAIDGAHGAYFEPPTIESLARCIREPSPAMLPSGPVADVAWTAARGADDVTLSADAPPSLAQSADLGLVPIWQRQDGSLARIDRDDWAVPIAPGRHWRAVLPLPPPPGPWNVIPVLCRLDHGPQSWPINRLQALHIA